MGTSRERRLHSREFKLEAVRLVTEGGRSKTEVAQSANTLDFSFTIQKRRNAFWELHQILRSRNSAIPVL
jgi:transposase-like protein